MSNKAITLVGDRARAGKSDLLLLVKIADACDDDGRNAWLETPAMARWLRSSERGAQGILRRLEQTGEIEIEYNDAGRAIALRGGRTFQPKWFIHVRCICEWEAYQREPRKPAQSAGSVVRLRTGRPRRKPAEVAGSGGEKTRSVFVRNPQVSTPKPAKTGSAYKEGSGNDLVVEQEQGSAPLSASRKNEARTPEENLPVLTKLAHEVLELYALTEDVSERDIVDGIELRCQADVYNIAVNREVVYQAIAAAVYQRRRAGKSAVLKNSPGDAAFRMKEAG